MFKKKTNRGFTLVELMIVLVILGILMAIAIPAYNTYIERARRNDAKSALTAAAQAMERFYTENANYNNAQLGTAATAIAKTTSPDGYYTIGFDSTPTAAAACGAVATTNPSAGAYRLCATPTGSQANDSCGTLSLSHTGAKLPATGCW